MPLTLTVADLAAAIRLEADGSVPPEPQLTILHRQIRVAEAEIDGYAPGASDYTKDEAAIRMIGYLYDSPNTALNNAPQVNAFRMSGAMALLHRWHVPGSAAVTVSTPEIDLDAPTTIIPETIISPSHPVHVGTHFRYIGWSDGASIDQAELDAAVSYNTDRLIVPARATNGYIFAGFPADIGAPDSVFLDGNPTNVIGGWIEQTIRLHRDDEDVVILVTDSLISPALVGRIWTFGYSSVMPVDFVTRLRSLAADGKLIASNFIAAAAGKKIVQDVSEDANNVTLTLENETQQTSTVTIPKNAAGSIPDASDTEDGLMVFCGLRKAGRGLPERCRGKRQRQLGGLKRRRGHLQQTHHPDDPRKRNSHGNRRRADVRWG